MGTYGELVESLRKYKKIGVCHSGGACSVLLLKASADAVGKENVTALTAHTDFFTDEGIERARRSARYLDIKHLVIGVRMLGEEKIIRNASDICYHCKKMFIGELAREAKREGLDVLLDASLCSRTGKESTGLKAALEEGLVFPLIELKTGREEVKSMLTDEGLRRFTYEPDTCLATRFETGVRIDAQNLKEICALEMMTGRMGFDPVRVRLLKDGIRIEVEESSLSELMEQREEIERELKDLGHDRVEFSAIHERTCC
jgi:uncharacterized protein